MKTITEQLADALRDAVLCVGPDRNPETFKCASDALAAYDAQQAQPVGLWVHWTDGERDYIGPAAGGDFIAEFPKNSEHAARIVACVNAHDTLVSALRTILADKGSASFNDDLEAYDAAIQTASDALAQAGVTP